MAASDGSSHPANIYGNPNGTMQPAEQHPNLTEELEDNERKQRVNAMWEKMNRGVPAKMLKPFLNKPSSTENKTATRTTPDWMVTLGLAPKKTSANQEALGKRPANLQNGANEEAKRLAAAALSAVRDAASAANATAGKGKVEITEVRDFAGQEIEVKKLVDADSKEAVDKAKAPGGPPTALDAIVEQIKKKSKLSVLDKTRKDWGEFKEENKGLEEELDAYKKSSNQYLEKVSFLQRTDLREFEREREARLALQAKRKTDVPVDDAWP